MAKVFESWTVLPHEPLEKHGENLWTVGGKMPNGKTPRVMTVARLRSGKLLIHNAIALEEPLMAEMLAFGEPAALLVPNGFHRQDAKIYKQRFPEIKVYCPKGSTKKVSEVVPVDGDYSAVPNDETVQVRYVEGCKVVEGMLEIRSVDGISLVFNDLICNMPKLGGAGGFFLAPTGRPSVPRVSRWMIVKDKRVFGDTLLRLAALPKLRRLIVSHGAIIADNPGAVLRDVAQELMGQVQSARQAA